MISSSYKRSLILQATCNLTAKLGLYSYLCSITHQKKGENLFKVTFYRFSNVFSGLDGLPKKFSFFDLECHTIVTPLRVGRLWLSATLQGRRSGVPSCLLNETKKKQGGVYFAPPQPKIIMIARAD